MKVGILSTLLIVCRHSIDFCPMNSEFQLSRMNIIFFETDSGIILWISRRKIYLSTGDVGNYSPLPGCILPAAKNGFFIFKRFFKNQKKNNISWHVKIMWNSNFHSFETLPCSHLHVLPWLLALPSHHTADWTSGDGEQLCAPLLCTAVPCNDGSPSATHTALLGHFTYLTSSC